VRTTLVVPLGKSPQPPGRIGPMEWQDWYRELEMAVDIAEKSPDSEILVLSNLHFPGLEPEADYYTRMLYLLGAETVRKVRDGYQTSDQIDRAFEMAEQENKDLILISSVLHYPRVQWLIWRHPNKKMLKVRHLAAWGLPRPMEGVSDIVATFLYPVIDLLGGRAWLQGIYDKRRKSGRF
jgi:hypothetical protein